MTDAAADAVLALLNQRDRDATICPSEVARALAAAQGNEDWRRHMPEVHAAVDALVTAGQVQLSWKGEPMAARGGPYRIAALDQEPERAA